MTGLYARLGKRALDLAGAVLLLLLLTPLLAALALAGRIALGPGVLFRQPRLGRAARPFTLIKFRSMRDGTGPDAARLTRYGAWLRRTSLDELPSLINVLRGEMSLVGPRPLLVADGPALLRLCPARFAVRPGLTGPVQVGGRNALPWAERLALDADYARAVTFRRDLALLLATPATLFSAEGIAAPGHAAGAPLAGESPP
ncbi:sugar transferase [Elioraea tepidiphila]|jgi:lipopolysaccharide/colanic/teichoic acid biosynthesis glycosyltransferase|uniref:sugar transferase n=1 Tax=Elioraea tepidiphila TaxID=457934 RepID=UPI002FDB0DFD